MVSKRSRAELRAKKHMRIRNRFKRYIRKTASGSIQKQ